MRSGAYARSGARVTVVLLLTAALAVPAGTVGAEPTLDELRQETDEAERRHSDLRSDLRAAEERLEELEAEFSLAVDEYHQVAEALDETDARLAGLEGQVAALTDEVAEREARVAAVIRDLYQRRTGLAGVEVLLGGGGPAETAQRLGYLRRVQRHQAVSVEGYVAERKALARQEADLAEAREEQAELAAELDERRADLEERAEEQGREMARLEEEVASARARLSEARSAQQAEEQRIEQERRERERRRRQAAAADRSARDSSGGSSSGAGGSSGGSSGGSVAGAPSAAAAKAVEAAKSQIGTPYKWGGTSPSTGFDCSGLAVWAYSQAGVHIPYRSTKAQFANLPKVARSDLKPGDLVYFRYPVGHMGIYIGNGQMVEAPRTGLNVRIRPINRSDYRGARRPTG